MIPVRHKGNISRSCRKQTIMGISGLLNKQDNFRKAYHNFNIQKVASYGETDRQRLLNDASVIRNRLKIDAAIHNAGIILKLYEEYGPFKNWLDKHHLLTKQEWTGLFKRTFSFTDREIVNEFFINTGYLKGAHIEKCPNFKESLN
ncbi:MAG: DNA-3-methyladenine glycosylase I [Bacteroidales bacterium]|nr:DNA-3-methyladenine glycosylase I [Bacteroidales bacterium]